MWGISGVPGAQANFVTSCITGAGSVLEGHLRLPVSLRTARSGSGSGPLQCLQAFNWGGFDDGSTFLGGLYVNRSIDVGDMAMVVYRAQLLGFNAVRLPFRSAASMLSA